MSGLFVIISGPSGGGKSTVISKLVSVFENATRLVTTTSRTPRPGEHDGVDYHFITKEEFEQGLENGDFLEYNMYSENLYGVRSADIKAALLQYDIIFSQIDVNGKKAVDATDIETLSIFLMPESIEQLRERLIARKSMSDTDIEHRLETAQKEMNMADIYDHIVINHDGELERTVDAISALIRQQKSLDKD